MYFYHFKPHGRKGGKFKPRSLKELTKQHLGIQIQSGEHDPVRISIVLIF